MKFKQIFKIILLVLSLIATLLGGIMIAGSCSYTTTAGGFSIDYTPVISIFGLVLLILGLCGLIANIKKRRKILLRGIVIYGVLLGIFCIYVGYSSASDMAEIYKDKLDFVNILPPNILSVIIALFSVIGLIAYPIYKYEKDKESAEWRKTFYIKK